MSDDAFWFGEVQYEVLEGKDGIRKVYDEMAYGYDYSRYLYWTRRMEEDEERITEKWFNGLSPSVLDIGCGTGRYSIRLQRRVLRQLPWI